MESRTQALEARRLDLLEQQAALHGPNTEPAILIEIAELRHKARPYKGDPQHGSFVNSLDFDLVRSSVAALLMRVGNIETYQRDDKKSRWSRQLIHDVWMLAMSIVVVIILVLLLQGH